MTIQEIHKKILETTGIDCYSKSRSLPIPDIKTIFYHAIVGYAEDHINLKKTSDFLNINHSTIIHHLNKPFNFLNYDKRCQKAFDLFFKKESVDDIEWVKKRIYELEARLKKLEN